MRKVLLQAGVIPYRVRDGDVEVLLITSRSSGDWIVPKGMVDAGLTVAEAAVQEAEEEAGVQGVLGPLLGYLDTSKARIALYSLEVEREMEDYLEKGMRRRRWFRAKEAADKVREPDLGTLIKQLRKMCRLQSPPAG